MHLSAGWTSAYAVLVGVSAPSPARHELRELGMSDRGCVTIWQTLSPADFYPGGHLFAHFLPDGLQNPAGWARLRLQPSPGWSEWGDIYHLGMQVGKWERLLSPAIWVAGGPSPLHRNGPAKFWSRTKPFLRKTSTWCCSLSCWQTCWQRHYSSAVSAGEEGIGVRLAP